MSKVTAQRFEQHIVSRILNKEFPEGQRLKPVRQLASEYGISYVTALRRIHKLCDEGYLERHHGSGVYVRSRERIRIAVVPGLVVSDSFMNLLHLFEESMPSRSAVDCAVETIQGETGQEIFEQMHRFDVIFLSDFVVTQGFPLEELMPLGDLAELTETERNDYYPKVIQFFSHDAHLRMLPIMVSPMVLFYNRSLIERAGLSDQLRRVQTLDNLVEVHQRVRTEQTDRVEGLTFGFDYKRVSVLLRALCPNLPQTSSLTFRDEKVRDGLRSLKAFLGQMDIAYPDDDQQKARTRFARGETWALLDLTTRMREIRQQADFVPDVLPMPATETELWCSGVAVTEAGSRKPGVRELLKFFKSTSALEIIGREGYFVPARRSSAEKVFSSTVIDGRHPMRSLPDVVAKGFLPHAQTLWLERACQSALDAWDFL